MKRKLLLSTGANLVLLGVILYQFQTNGTTTRTNCCNSYEGSTMTIGAKDVLKMIRSYRNERQQIINYAANSRGLPASLSLASYGKNDENSFIDSRAITFPIDTIKKYICSIENQIESNPDLNEYKLSGLRFYYTVYDESSEYVKNEVVSHKPRYENTHSLLIVPTVYDRGEATHIDFEPNLFAEKKRLDQSVFEDNTPLQFLHLSADDVAAGRAVRFQNKGSLCPPPKPCDGYTLLNLADDLCMSTEINSSCPD